jgi:hypothetical protein
MSVDGSTTVRVYGLDAKATSIGTVQFELESLLSDGLRLGNSALAAWRGKHAEAFVENANRLVRELDRLVTTVATAKRTADRWPDPARRDPFGDEAASSERLAVTVEPGTSAAVPEKLDEFRSWCDAVAVRVQWLAGSVNLDGVMADVTRPVPVSGLVAVPLGSGLLVEDPAVETTTTTSTTLPGRYVHLPDVSAGTTKAVDSAARLGPWTGAVALAFRLGDDRLLALVEAHPDLADELLAGFEDQQLGGESALAVLLAYFDLFDRASDGREDGDVSWDDLWVMTCSADLPPYVAQAARYLRDNPTLFDLVETSNDGMDYARDVLGGNGDQMISVGDIETVLQLNDRLAVVEQNFDAFDTAAHPGGPADGRISMGDLRALADGDGALAEAASWLLDHDGALTRLSLYADAKAGYLGRQAPVAITAASLVLLAVDQQVYADHPAQSAGFVERRFDTLMSAGIGGRADAGGIGAVFDAALTRSDQRGPLMERVIAEVAADGTIHNPGLHGAFANGAAANMPLLDQRINAPFQHTMSENLRRAYLETHDFLREVSRSPDAAEHLRQAVYDYGLSETALAPEGGEARHVRLGDLGRMQAFLDMAQDNALTGAALDEIRAATGDSALGPSAGSVTDYGITHVPVAGTINDIADGMGISAGDGIDWLLGRLGAHSPDAFDMLSDAEKIDRIHSMSSRIDREVWVALARFDSDPAVRNAAQGQPFVDGNGALKPHMSPDEAQAFREWAAPLAIDPGLTFADADYIDGGFADIGSPPEGLSLEGRR